MISKNIGELEARLGARLLNHTTRQMSLTALDASHLPRPEPGRGRSRFVTRSISGHATTTMHQHYSTVSGDEVRSGLAKVVDLLGFAQQRARAGESGDPSGDRNQEAPGAVAPEASEATRIACEN